MTKLEQLLDFMKIQVGIDVQIDQLFLLLQPIKAVYGPEHHGLDVRYKQKYVGAYVSRINSKRFPCGEDNVYKIVPGALKRSYRLVACPNDKQS